MTDPRRDSVVRAALQWRNTLIVGGPGSGRTSLLYRIKAEARKRDPPRPVILVDASDAPGSREVTDLLARTAAAAGWTPPYLPPRFPDDPFGPTMQIRNLREAPKDSIVLIDNPDVKQAQWLFGSMRDEFWNLPVHVTAAVDPKVAERLNQPPMDAFFDTVTTIEELERPQT